MADAIVIGAGPNGLVAANVLADAGWDVLVLEAQDEPGGAVRSAELTEPGFRSDVFSSFYPMAAASPAIRALRLEEHGLRWRRPPVAVAHPTPDGGCAAVFTGDVDATAATLEGYAPGDGDAWRRLYARWERVSDALLHCLLTPFPPVRAAARLVGVLGPAGVLPFLRFGMLPVRRAAEEEFGGAGGGNLLAGNALHADFMPESSGGALFGWLLTSLGQQLGFPVPEGGAGELTGALVRRLGAGSGQVRCGAEVEAVLLRGGRAAGVRLRSGEEVAAGRAVLADVSAPALYGELVGSDRLPEALRASVERFQWDLATFKVDWALDGPIPWTAPDARTAGTVHVADGMDALTRHSTAVVLRELPEHPFLVLGQYASADPSRMPAGKEVAWAYTHLAHRSERDAAGDLRGDLGDPAQAEAFADRMEGEVERFAPGFRELVRARHVLTPDGLRAADANLVSGALNGGTAQLHQQLVFRPVPGLGRAETPFPGLYLASASAHPGGGVHGACGANAARAALAATTLPGRALHRLARARSARRAPGGPGQGAGTPGSPGSGAPSRVTSGAS